MQEYYPNATFVGEKQNQKTGDFEVYVDGKLVYSKKETKKFPNMGEEIYEAIKGGL